MAEDKTWQEQKERYKTNFMKNPVDDEEFANFLRKAEEVGKLVNGLASTDPEISERAKVMADQLLGVSKNEKNLENINEDDLVIKTNKTVINPNAYKEVDPENMSKEAWMKSVEADAKQRAEDRRQRTEIAERLKRQGNTAFRQGQYEKALKYFIEGTDNLKDSCVLWTNRALTHLTLGLYHKTIEDCEWALKANRSSMKALLYKAKAHHLLDQEVEREEALSQVLELHPEHETYIQEYVAEFKKVTSDIK